MSYQATAHCDVCDEPRRHTNHWFQIRRGSGRLVIEPFMDNARGVLHLCGEACLARMVARNAASLYAPPDAPGQLGDAPLFGVNTDAQEATQ